MFKLVVDLPNNKSSPHRVEFKDSSSVTSKAVQPKPGPCSTKVLNNNNTKEGGFNQKLILFKRGKATSGAPTKIGTNQFGNLRHFYHNRTLSSRFFVAKQIKFNQRVLRIVSEDPTCNFIFCCFYFYLSFCLT